MTAQDVPPNDPTSPAILRLAMELSDVLPREKLFRGSGLIGGEILFESKQYRIVKDVQEPLSMELLRKVLGLWTSFEMGGVIIDRNPMPHWIYHLIKEMLSGRFEMADLMFAFGTCDEYPNIKFRLNGQNTSWGLAAVFENYPLVWARLLKQQQPTVRHYHAKLGTGLRAAYCSMDNGKYRTKDQRIAAILVGYQEFAAFRPKVVTLLGSGLSHMKWFSDGQRTLQSANDVTDAMMGPNKDAVLLIGSFLNDQPKSVDTRHVYKAPVVAGMLTTADISPRHVATFWEPVRDGINLTDRKDPRGKLRTALMQMGRSESTRASGHRVHEDLLFYWTYQAWNAWCRGNSVNLAKRLPDEDMQWLKPKVKMA